MKIKDSTMTFLYETDEHILLGTRTGELRVVNKHKHPVQVESADLSPADMQEFVCQNGDHVQAGFVNGKWYFVTRKPIKVIKKDNYLKDSIEYEFQDKHGWVTHTRLVGVRAFYGKDHVMPCPACLMHRQMIDLHRIGDYCPHCRGKILPELVCTCGQIGHKVSCPMGSTATAAMHP